MRKRRLPQARRNPRSPTFVLVVSPAHGGVVKDLSRRDRRTMRVITETAIEEYARRNGIEIPSGGAALQEGAAA